MGAKRAAGPGTPWALPPDRLLAEGLAALGLPPTNANLGVAVRGIDSITALLGRYMNELELFNAAFDLVGADNRSDIVVRHILDSLAPWRLIADRLAAAAERRAGADGAGSADYLPVMADVGSGAGLPGIPLAIAFPETPITLIERMSKRCAFLEGCKAVLRLGNVTVLESEVEKAPAAAFDLVAFRAFRPLDAAMYRSLERLVRDGGTLAAWKARRDKIDEEMEGIRGETGNWEAIPLKVPFMENEERHLVLVERRGDEVRRS